MKQIILFQMSETVAKYARNWSHDHTGHHYAVKKEAKDHSFTIAEFRLFLHLLSKWAVKQPFYDKSSLKALQGRSPPLQNAASSASIIKITTGIVCCGHAHYQHVQCQRALNTTTSSWYLVVKSGGVSVMLWNSFLVGALANIDGILLSIRIFQPKPVNHVHTCYSFYESMWWVEYPNKSRQKWLMKHIINVLH